MKIKVLSEKVINRIAAGEVVERPSSIVRELVDNSIDAGSSEIQVVLSDGGKGLVRVIDNGSGMSKDDSLLAFERHATSKISTEDELNRIETYGFRGEALASIAAVSKVRLRTRRGEDDVASELRLVGGVLKDVYPCSGKVGTDLEIRNLFFNTPVRKKFLKTANTEEQRVKHWLMRASLPNYGIHFRLKNDDREILNIPTHDSLKARAQSFLTGSMVPFDYEAEGIRVSGTIGHPALSGSDIYGFVILVNGRVVMDSQALRAVKEGFGGTLKDREIPVGYLSIEVNPADVDVNIHPQKSEVRFVNPREVYRSVMEGVQRGVAEFRAPVEASQLSRRGSFVSDTPSFSSVSSGSSSSYSPPSSRGGSWKGAEVVAKQDSFGFEGNAVQTPENREREALVELFDSVEKESVNQDQRDKDFLFSSLRYFGRIFKCYLLCEYGEEFVIVDMHAAHERYNYNLIRNQHGSKQVDSQLLLIPITVTLTSIEIDNLKSQEELLGKFGFDLEFFDQSTVMVRAVPAVVKDSTAERLVREIASEDLSEFAEQKIERVIDAICARLACHASIRSGDDLTSEGVYQLFKSLDSEEFSAACPHGRPVLVSFSKGEVEKWFGRDR